MISLFADSTTFDGVIESPPLRLTKETGPYTYDGCYAESGGKTFDAKRQDSQKNTVENCRDFCGGSSFFGLQYSSECYCGASLRSSSVSKLTKTIAGVCKGCSCGAIFTPR
jgi:hypothetical protein